MRKGLAVFRLIIVFLAFVGILLLYANGVQAAEQVVKLRRSYQEVSNQVFCEGEAACNDSLFYVYTVQETNAIRDELKSQIDAATRQGGIVDQRINAAEDRLRDELNRVRRDFQGQIDELKRQIEKLKKINNK